MKQSVSTQSLDEGENPKLIKFKESLQKLAKGYCEQTISIPNKLVELKLSYRDLENLYKDIYLQMFKFGKSPPGKLVKLYSPALMNHGHAVYVMRNQNGDFQVILKVTSGKRVFFYYLDEDKIHSWRPINALLERMDTLDTQFQQELPPHLAEIFQHDQSQYSIYHAALKEHLSDLNTLKRGKIFTIEPDPERKRPYPIHVIRTETMEYCVLLENPNDRRSFIRMDVEKKELWNKKFDIFLDDNTVQFLESIGQAKMNVERYGLPTELAKLIEKQDLIAAYQYMLNSAIANRIRKGQSFQLKKSTTGLARTLTIVRKSSGELMLMLETKTKLNTGQKDKSRVVGEGAFGIVKPCWQIDSIPPREWVNKVSKSNLVDPSNVYSADFEAHLSQNIVENIEQNNETETPNVTLLGELYLSGDDIKITQYSSRALCDLSHALAMIQFNKKDQDRIIQSLLSQAALMHAQGKIHQDIKPLNILVFRDSEGYYAKIADFGSSYDPSDINSYNNYTRSTLTYESPEVSLAYEDPTTFTHQYFHGSKELRELSLGYLLNQADMGRDFNSKKAKEYRLPNSANDIWALGITIFIIKYRHLPTTDKEDLQKIYEDPLLFGMLQTNRKLRFSAKEALACFNEYKNTIVTDLTGKRKVPITFNDIFPNATAEKTSKSQSSAIDIEFFLNNRPSSDELTHQFILELEKIRIYKPFLLQDALRTIVTSDLGHILYILHANPPSKIKYNLTPLSDEIEQCIKEKKKYIRNLKKDGINPPQGISFKDYIEQIMQDFARKIVVETLQNRRTVTSPKDS